MTPEDSVILPNAYHAKSAIHLLVTNVPIATPQTTIAAVEEDILKNVKQYSTLDYIYIVNHLKHLVGVLSIKDVYRLPKSKVLEDVVGAPVVSVRPHAHRETVCALALKHNIKAIPVVDTDEKFLGVIPSDIILKVAYDELSEDIFIGEGIHAKEYNSIATMTNSPFRLLGKRLPWLIAGLIGGLLAAYVVQRFEALFEKEALIIWFMPLIVYISDAVGSQSQTIFIRSLAIDSKINIISYLVKEIRVGALIAICLSALIILILGVFGKLFFGIVLGISLFLTIVISILAAILIPWIIVYYKKDPAIGSGPFATILRDIASIGVYFSISHVLFSLV